MNLLKILFGAHKRPQIDNVKTSDSSRTRKDRKRGNDQAAIADKRFHYNWKGLGFSFDLPHGWRKDADNDPLTFFGPNGRIGVLSEYIQMKFAPILPQYRTPESRKKILAERGARVDRGCIGAETNVIVLRRAKNSEISIVRDGIQYTIMHPHDATTKAAIKCLKKSVRFPTPQEARAAVKRWSKPAYQATRRMSAGLIPAVAKRPQAKSKIIKCATCNNRMQIQNLYPKPGILLSAREITSGVGVAERCVKCGNVYCFECYPKRFFEVLNG